MKLDDWKARLRAPEILLPAPTPAPVMRPSVVKVLDEPPGVPPLNLLVKPESLLNDGPGLNASFKKFVTLEDRDHELFASIGHDSPLIEVENDRDILAASVTLRFSLTNQSHFPMLLPAKFRGARRPGELPSISMIIRPYREPRFNSLLGGVAEFDEALLAKWSLEDAIQFGAWPEDTQVSFSRLDKQRVSITLATPDGATASFSIVIAGDKLSLTLPPFLGARVCVDERVFHGR